MRFGKLVVLERDTSKKGTYWICKCDCGNVISTRTDTLTRTNSKKCCGCSLKQRNSEAHLKNEVGNVYNYLTVIKRVESDTSAAKWLCQCKCGKFTEVTGFHLRNGTVQSCGCKRLEGNNGFDESNKRYGKLTVLNRAPNRENNSHRFWLCKCDCGNEVEVQGTYLRKGISTNCGCEVSAGEQKIHKLLTEFNISFIRQYTFPDLLGKNKKRLRYDFGIINENKEILYLIEYDGIQHFFTGFFNNTLEDLNQIQEYDERKNEYCKQNNIPLIRIKYTEYENLSIEDLKLETSKYIVK